MLEDVKREKFEELIERGYSLDMVYILLDINKTGELFLLSKKISNIFQKMIRKELVDNDGNILEKGKALLNFLNTPVTVLNIPRKKPISNDVFSLWWKEYPASDTFTYQGTPFRGSRALRVKKDDCKRKIDQILSTGEYTIQELVDALKLEKLQKMEKSQQTGQNKMTFFQNSLTYLNQNTYDVYVELVRQGHLAKFETKSAIKKEFDGINI